MTDGQEKALFVTPWTGGPRAVAVAVFRDRAIVGHWNNSRQTIVPLTADQVVELRKLSVESFDPLCEQAEAVAVADRLNQISGGYLVGFSRMLPDRHAAEADCDDGWAAANGFNPDR